MQTKKILSLILAVLMVLSVLPMTFIGATAEDVAEAAPTVIENVGKKKYETVTLYAGPTSPTGTGWITYNTDLSKLTASGKNAKDAVGVLIDVSWNKSGLTQGQIKFRWSGGDGKTDGSYYSNDGATTGQSATNNWLEVKAAAFTGTVFIPKAELNNWASTDFKVINFALSCGQSSSNAHASFSNVRLAYEVSAPATLPNGKTYASSVFHTNDVAADHRKNTSGNWLSGFGNGVWAMMQDGAEGIMFKVDTSNAADAASETLSMTFAASFTGYRADGSKMETYIIATPKQAAGWSSNVVATAEDKSTWYYSNDGATWNEVSATGTSGSYVNIPVGKQVTYVYVPMEAFWTKEGETFIKTGTNVKTDRTVNYYDLLEMVDDNFKLGSLRHLIGGGETNPARDETVSISDWKIVDHVQAVEDMATTPLLRNGSYCGGAKYHPNWTGGDYFQKDAEQAFKTAKGIVFEIHADPNASNPPAFSVMLSANRADGTFKNAYIHSIFGQANTFGTTYVKGEGDKGSGEKAADQSSVSYWSEDGKNWTAVIPGSETSTAPYMPKSTSKAYVYIPFESFWSRHALKDLAQDANASAARVDAKDWAEALGEGWQFNYIHVYYGSNVEFHNWSLVADESYVKSDEAPYTLPDGSHYTYDNLFINGSFTMSSTQNTDWNSNLSKAAVQGINEAEGIMFKLDTSTLAATYDSYKIWFAASMTGKNGITTYLMSNAGCIKNYGEAKNPEGATSTWYYSVDGATWLTIESGDEFMPVLHGINTEAYVYVPFTSMYIKSGETYMTTGTHNTAEPGMSYLAARELAGGWASMGSFKFFTTGGSLTAGAANNFRFVYKTELPEIGTNLTYSFLKQNVAVPNWSGGSNFKDGAERAFEMAKGVMFELDTSAHTGATPAQMSMMLSLQHASGGNGGNNYIVATSGYGAKYFGNSTVPSGSVSTWWYSEDGETWKSISSDDTSAFMTLPDDATKYYVYIPFSSFWSRYNADYITGAAASYDKTKPSVRGDQMANLLDEDWNFAYIHFYPGSGTDRSSLKASNWSFVYDTTIYDDEAPTMLPTVDAYSENALLKDSFDVMSVYHTKNAAGTYDQSGWQGSNILAANAADKLKAGADGIMFTVDTTKATCASDLLEMSFTLQISFNGRDTYAVATAGLASAYAQATRPESASSTWYYSTNGVVWNSVTTTSASKAGMTLGKGIAYVYVPMSSFWTRNSENYIVNGAAANKAESIVNWNDAIKMLPSNWTLGMSNFYFSGSASTTTLAQDANTKIYGWKIITEAGLKTQSTTLKNDFTYNVYANDDENTKVTFTMGGKTYEPIGVVQANGTVKYSFDNLIPQQITESITTTWTTTLSNGRKVTETKTFSVYDYLKSILADEAMADWHDLAQATINYAAAAQTREGTGFKGEKVAAEDVKPVSNPVDRTKDLAGKDTISLALGEASGFNSAALLLEGTIQMKISVSEAITSVTYSINGRTGTATVVDGAVYIPIYAYEMADTLTVTDAVNTADVLTVSVNWYLTNASSRLDYVTNLLDALANYGVAAANMK